MQPLMGPADGGEGLEELDVVAVVPEGAAVELAAQGNWWLIVTSRQKQVLSSNDFDSVKRISARYTEK